MHWLKWAEYNPGRMVRSGFSGSLVDILGGSWDGKDHCLKTWRDPAHVRWDDQLKCFVHTDGGGIGFGVVEGEPAVYVHPTFAPTNSLVQVVPFDEKKMQAFCCYWDQQGDNHWLYLAYPSNNFDRRVRVIRESEFYSPIGPPPSYDSVVNK